MTQSSTIHFAALRTHAVLAVTFALASCAHGSDPSASSESSDASVSHAGGSATMAPTGSGGSDGTSGSSMDLSGGSAGQGGTGESDLVDAEMSDVGTGSGGENSAEDATIAANDSGRSDDAAALDAGCPNPSACSLRATLIHRYMFDGTGTVATDSIGTADGTIMNTALTGTGSLVLAGGVTDQFVDLPNNIIHTLTNATFEVWLTWDGGGNWQRIFDFGNSDSGTEGVQSAALSTIHMTPLANVSNALRFSFKRSDQTIAQETDVEAAMPLASGVVVHVAGVVDGTNHMMYLYRDGAVQASKAFADSLSLLTDINNWLGRSQYAGDPELGGMLHEFRIYNAALSAAQIQASFAAGQNPTYLAK